MQFVSGVLLGVLVAMIAVVVTDVIFEHSILPEQLLMQEHFVRPSLREHVCPTIDEKIKKP